MKFVRSRLFRLLTVAAGLVIVASLSRGVYEVWKKRDVLRERQDVLGALDREQRELQQKLEEAQSPAFVEKAAREKLGMIKEGEAIVLVPKSEENLPASPELQRGEPNWKKWWKLFF